VSFTEPAGPDVPLTVDEAELLKLRQVRRDPRVVARVAELRAQRPPLTDRQRSRLAALLRPTGDDRS